MNPSKRKAQIGSNILRRLLTHPLARDVDLDDPRSTILRRRILDQKVFLRRIYEQWYSDLKAALPQGEGGVLELGSGAGFFRTFVPELITSDVLRISDLSLVLDARHIPIRDGALKAIVMIDVLHHIPQPRAFFREADRCVRPGGAVLMIEPWVTTWSRLVYSKLHHEPFDPAAEKWEFPSTGPLSGANGAIPWILFQRDLSLFRAEFDKWRLKSVRLEMPFSYLLSGGLSLRAFTPGWAFGVVKRIEELLRPWFPKLAMFAMIELERLP